MKIMRLRVTNYRSIATLDETLEGGSAVARGGNGRGKTTVLRAIRAALAGNDISPDAIRKGATSAEILVDLDDHSVRRAITQSGSTLTVTRDGMKATKPQNYLNEILGSTPIDPIDLITMKPRDRRARILEALPCEITREQLLTWAPELPEDFNVEGHGLEVLDRAHKYFYDVRATANASAKEAARKASGAASVFGAQLTAPDPVDLSALQAAVDDAKREEHRLSARAEAAAAHEARAASTRERVESLRESAERSERQAEAIDVTLDAVVQARDHMVYLRAAVQKHEGVLRAAEEAWSRKTALEAEQKRALQQADELEATLATGEAPPTDQAIIDAEDAVTRANEALERGRESEKLRAAFAEASKLRDAADADAKRAKQLDEIVVALREEAPRVLLAKNEAIPGLTLEGDDVMLDGVRLDALCGAEQMRLAVQIARRANGKSRGRMLIVDGLERLDPEQLEVFYAEAMRDDWQLIATRVDRGDIVIEHLSRDAMGRSEAAE